MTVLITLSKTTVWQDLIANCNLDKIEEFSIQDETTDQSKCFIEPVELSDVEQLINQSLKIVLCYESPDYKLASALSQNEALSDAVSQCNSLYRTLLNIHRKARRQLTLINLNDIPKTEIIESTGLELAGITFSPFVTQNSDSIHTVLAQKVIEQDDEFNTLCQSLFASSVNLVTKPYELDISKILEIENEKAGKLHSLETAQKVLNDEFESNLSQLEELKQEQELLNSTIVDLQDKAESDKNRISELQERLTGAQLCANKLDLERSDLVAEQELLQNTISELQVEIENKTQRVEDQEGLNISLQEQLTNAANENTELKAEKDLLLKTVTALQDELQHQLSNAHELDQALRDTKVNESNERQQLEVLLAESNAEIELLEAKAAVLMGDSVSYECAKEDIKNLKLELRAALESLSYNELKVKELVSVIEQSTDAYSTLEKENKQLIDDSRKLSDEKAQIKSNSLREVKKLEREITNLESKYQKITRELLSTTDKLQYADEELNQIKSSASWKLSAPARAVSKKLKKEDRENQLLKQNVGLLYTSELFDTEWYLTSYPDIREAGVDPAEHYLTYGAKEGRLPCASFDGDWYLRQNPDVAESGMNPLIHYIKYGIAEGRAVSPKLLSKD